jgi:hypothetical protein
VAHTAKFRPWRIKTAIAFRDRAKAAAFEIYLKIHFRPRVRQKAPLTTDASERGPLPGALRGSYRDSRQLGSPVVIFRRPKQIPITVTVSQSPSARPIVKGEPVGLGVADSFERARIGSGLNIEFKLGNARCAHEVNTRIVNNAFRSIL